jgi:small subunit ribosomal protein S17
MAAENTAAAPATPATDDDAAKRVRPRKIGVVTSDKMQKTITVVIERLEKHRLYKKYVRKRTVLKAHDEKNEAKVGAVVELEFARPLSKTKRWNLVRILRQGDGG